ncbi:DUF397 domain-containing protein [Embleya sp. AB8]|uniref:DUF397 domain-containing protein n=1 Tax=Embleya sp. AB8 TaxID=3156304 RepID=UPI003C7398C1
MINKQPTWRKSTYSGGGGNECVEVAQIRAAIGVRDSKDTSRRIIEYDATAWSRFAAYLVDHIE